MHASMGFHTVNLQIYMMMVVLMRAKTALQTIDCAGMDMFSSFSLYSCSCISRGIFFVSYDFVHFLVNKK